MPGECLCSYHKPTQENFLVSNIQFNYYHSKNLCHFSSEMDAAHP